MIVAIAHHPQLLATAAGAMAGVFAQAAEGAGGSPLDAVPEAIAGGATAAVVIYVLRILAQLVRDLMHRTTGLEKDNARATLQVQDLCREVERLEDKVLRLERVRDRAMRRIAELEGDDG